MLTGGASATITAGSVKILIRIQIQIDSNYIQILSNFDHSKNDLPELKKIARKYGCEGFEERKNKAEASGWVRCSRWR
jgi:hypothetical protein